MYLINADVLFFWRSFLIAYTKIAVVPLEMAFTVVNGELEGRGYNLTARGL